MAEIIPWVVTGRMLEGGQRLQEGASLGLLKEETDGGGVDTAEGSALSCLLKDASDWIEGSWGNRPNYGCIYKDAFFCKMVQFTGTEG